MIFEFEALMYDVGIRVCSEAYFEFVGSEIQSMSNKKTDYITWSRANPNRVVLETRERQRKKMLVRSLAARGRGSGSLGSGSLLAPSRPNHLKALICVKRVIDYAVKVRVQGDKKGVEIKDVKLSMNSRLSRKSN